MMFPGPGFNCYSFVTGRRRALQIRNSTGDVVTFWLQAAIGWEIGWLSPATPPLPAGPRPGCNTYGAGYRVDGTSLSVSSLYSTKMHCNEPEGVMEQESRCLNLVASATGYRIDGDRLDLLDEGRKGPALLQRGSALISSRSRRPERPVPARFFSFYRT